MNAPRYPSLSWPWVGLILCLALLGQEYMFLAVGMGDALHRQRRDQDRERDLRPEHGRRRRDVLHVDEDPRPELAPLERGEVLPERDLVPRAAGEVGVRVGVEPLLGESLIVPDVDGR